MEKMQFTGGDPEEFPLKGHPDAEAIAADLAERLQSLPGVPADVLEAAAEVQRAAADKAAGRIIGTGVNQEATPGRQQASQHHLDSLYAYATKSEQHLWVVILTHLAGDQILDARDGQVLRDAAEMPMLDLETMVGLPAFICYVCEEPYTPLLRRRKCRGEAATKKGYRR